MVKLVGSLVERTKWTIDQVLDTDYMPMMMVFEGYEMLRREVEKETGDDVGQIDQTNAVELNAMDWRAVPTPEIYQS